MDVAVKPRTDDSSGYPDYPDYPENEHREGDEVINDETEEEASSIGERN